MLERLGNVVLTTLVSFVAVQADRITENVVDTTCMLQSGHAGLSVTLSHLQSPSQTSNESHLDPWAKDYVKDGDGDANSVAAPLTSQQLLRITCGSFIALLVLLLGVLACMITGTLHQSQMTWHILNHAIAAMSALLMFTAIKELLQHFLSLFGLKYSIVYSVVLFLVTSLVAYSCLLKREYMSYEDQEQKHRHMLIVGLVGMYIASFAAIDTYQILVQSPEYVKSNSAYAFAFVLAVLAVVALAAIASTLREVPSYEDQFAAATVGYLFCHAVETAIIRSQPDSTAKLDTDVLLLVAVVFALLSLIAAAFSKGDGDTEPGRISKLLRNVCLMASAWCVLDAISWQVSAGSMGKSFALAPGTATASFLAALILTSVVLIVFVVLCLYSIVSYENPWRDFQISGFRLIVGAMGFIIGKAWADYLVNLFVGTGPDIFTPQSIAVTVGVAVTCIVLTALVLSLWISCLLPRSKLPRLQCEEK
jgi:hypothetical protein